jgi:hypothetical protein
LDTFAGPWPRPVSAEAAQLLVREGIELTDIRTCGTLEIAIAIALGAR